MTIQTLASTNQIEPNHGPFIDRVMLTLSILPKHLLISPLLGYSNLSKVDNEFIPAQTE